MAASSLKTEQDKIVRKLSQSSISDKKENVNTGQKKGQTDFIARNKAAFVKPSSSLTHRRRNSATNKENVLSTRKSEGTASRPQLNSNPSKVSSTIKLNANTSGKLAKKRVPDKSDKVDILTGLSDHNLIQIIEVILLYLSPVGLWNCRLVSTCWRDYTRNLFLAPGSREKLKKILKTRWFNGKHSRIELKLSGSQCYSNCQLNGRDCSCQPVCQYNNGSLVFLWGANRVKGYRKLNEQTPENIDHVFDRDQYQIKFSLAEGLNLETNLYLSSPVFMKPSKPVKTCRFRSHRIHLSENSMELCITSESGETRHVTPSTGIGRARRIDQLAASCGRLALLMESRVYVYSLEQLVDLNAEPADALLLIATRMNQSEVIFYKLFPDWLITVGRDYTIIMFSYWKQSSCSKSEFFN